MFGIGMTELMIIMVIALLVLGPTQLPKVARSIGKGMRELRRASDDLRTAVMFDDEDEKRYDSYTPPVAPQLPPREEVVDAVTTENSSDDPELVETELAIPGSKAAPAGAVARGAVSEPQARDPDDADDHAGMEYAPGSPELEQLLADAKAGKLNKEPAKTEEPRVDQRQKGEPA